MTNFDFIKKIDKDLFNIINDAEKLYRDEYFEQCMAQTRRFGETVCKNLNGIKCTPECTFDEMLATMKDNIKSEQEKEFIEDLYFLKKQGNRSVHSSSVKKDGILALECLQRAFEVAINYAVYYAKANSNILKQQFDIELLVTGKKNKATLTEKYNNEKKKISKPVKKVPQKQSYSMKTASQNTNTGYSFFQILFVASLFVTVLIFIIISVAL